MIIDTDTASDDAVALLMALVSPDIELVAITIVAGNVAMQQGSRNARYTVELCGRATPVYEGAVEPLLRETHRAEFFHGSRTAWETRIIRPQRHQQPKGML